MEEECGICCESYTKQTRKKVECPYCQFAACRACTGKYLLESCVDAKCMSCSKAWNTEMMYSAFTKTWMLNDWRVHVTKALLDRQKSMLAETQETRLPGYRMWQNCRKQADELSHQIAIKSKEIGRLMQERDRCSRLQENLQATGYQSSENDVNGERTARERGARFYFSCPSDTCRGLVGASGECGTCGLVTCQRCRADTTSSSSAEAAPHECDPQALATAELMRRDTKPCPTCHVPVYRISGCPQMFCTSCHNPWDWNTGKAILHGQVHNPHYFEFLAREAQAGRVDDFGNAVPREQEEVDCDADGRAAQRIPPHTVIRLAVNRATQVFGVPKVCIDLLMSVIQRISHLNYYQLPNHRAKVERAQADKWMERINFLLGRVSEQRLADMLWADEKQRQKSTEYIQLLETYLQVTAPRVTLIVRQLNSGQTYSYGVDPFKDLALVSNAALLFCDDGIRQLNGRYNSSLNTLSYQTQQDPTGDVLLL